VEGYNFIPGMLADRVYDGENISSGGSEAEWRSALSSYSYDQLGYGVLFDMQDTTQLPPVAFLMD